MSEMVERVADALRKMGCGESYGCDEIARAAIAVMREPTQKMIRAGYDDGEPTDCAAHWRDMIDEALR